LTIRRDKIIIIDIEATCWRGEPPPGEQNEIIEIGVCMLDVASLQLANKRSILVKPTRSKVSAFCTKLTSITPEMVDSGVNFADACQQLIGDYESCHRMWGSWGSYDKRMFTDQCASFFVEYPFSEHHFNVKDLFAKTINHRRKVGMMRALKLLEFTPEGTHHRGHDDAWNTARILAHMLKQHGQDILTPYW